MLYQVPLRRNASYLEREDDNTEVTQASRQKPERSVIQGAHYSHLTG